MGKCILLGNGINLHLGIKELESDKIKDRFLNLLRLEKGVFLSVFPHQWDFDTCYRSIKESNVYGIEVLSRYLYSSIKNANISEWSENDEDRLQDLVSCIALNAIFFNDSGKLSLNFNHDRLPNFERYDSIFTLNYYEIWDEYRKAIHLHGYFDLEVINSDVKYLLSALRKPLDEYSDATKELNPNAEYYNFHDIVFAPEGVMKNQLISVKGISLFGGFYPANDLFLVQSRQLYKELDGITEMDIFGLSPYGDDILIEALNKIKHITIFIHNFEKNKKEKEDWNKLLKTDYEFKDSSQIMDV